MKETKDNKERTEEIQDIIERMPGNLGIWITLIVFISIVSIIALGCFIKYPDTVSGQIIINANNSPIKLVANTSGKLLLNGIHSKDNIKEGDYIAIIQNASNLDDMLLVQKALKSFNISATNINNYISDFPKNVSLGELNAKYFSFINAYEQVENYYKDNLLTKQEEILKKLLNVQESNLEVLNKKLLMSGESLQLMGKFHYRDSFLFSKKVIAEADLDKTKMNYLSAKDSYNDIIKDNISFKEQIQETINKLQQTAIQKNEKEKQLRLDLIASYSDLIDNFKTWEDKYVFKSPIEGKVQFLNFWSNGHFIQQGEPVFTIVPLKNKMLGQMMLPAHGAGKVKINQEVIIKLENYPYEEYGTIKGHVSSISLTTNTVKTDKGNIESYLVYISLPHELKTNYGTKLDFQFEINGSAEIITNERRLASRLFDNLKYISKKQ